MDRPLVNSEESNSGRSGSVRGQHHLRDAPVEHWSVHNGPCSPTAKAKQQNTITPDSAHTIRPGQAQVHQSCESNSIISSKRLPTKRKLHTDDQQQSRPTKKTLTGLGQTTGGETSKTSQDRTAQALWNDNGPQQENVVANQVSRARTDHPDARLKVTEELTTESEQLVSDDPAARVNFQNTRLNFTYYGIYAIPILCSGYVEHQYPYEVVANPLKQIQHNMTESESGRFRLYMACLRQKALSIARKRSLTSPELGRREMFRGFCSPVIIDNCDLYLYGDKVHVATNYGLLLAAEYMRRVGVRYKQPVHFKGIKPSWMEHAEKNTERCRVLADFYPGKGEEAQGYMKLFEDNTVDVLERVSWDMADERGPGIAYGMRLEDGDRGWFPTSYICPTNQEDPVDQALSSRVSTFRPYRFLFLRSAAASQQTDGYMGDISDSESMDTGSDSEVEFYTDLEGSSVPIKYQQRSPVRTTTFRPYGYPPVGTAATSGQIDQHVKDSTTSASIGMDPSAEAWFNDDSEGSSVSVDAAASGPTFRPYKFFFPHATASSDEEDEHMGDISDSESMDTSSDSEILFYVDREGSPVPTAKPC